MNKIIQHITKHLAGLVTLALAASATSCTDDFPSGGVTGDGESQVSATIEFEPLVPALDESRGTPGNAIKYINNLTLFVYTGEGGLLQILNTSDLTDYKVEKDVAVTAPSGNKVDGSTEANQTQAESTTCRATFTLPLQYGNYMIYAVANMGDFPKDEETMKKYRTPDALKQLTVEWNSTNIAANNAMFGYMTASGIEHETAAGFDASPVAVNAPRVSLHAWLKRAASKVTLVYDGSGLKNGIQIYIKSVTIKDIPKYCKIGENNTVSKDYNELITTGESIYYDENGEMEPGTTENSSSHLKWMVVNKGNGLQGAVTRDESGKVVTPHSETNQALYFFENLQGDYKDAPNKQLYDKKQIWDNVGENITKPDQPDYKDNIPYGTYIEVEAYYTAMVTTDDSNPADDPEYTYVSNGKIKYRFMLGQDVHYNYNSYRNHHYKLTLGFKGYANQPDWHIEYIEEEPSLVTPPIFYVPYIYHQKSMFPVRIIGNCTSLTAEIVENNWAPYDPTQPDSVPPAIVGSNSDPLAFRWFKDAYTVTNVGGLSYYGLRNPWSSDGENEISSKHKVTAIWAGFLALRMPIEDPNTPMPSKLFVGEVVDYEYAKWENRQKLKKYYYSNKQNIREFTSADLQMGSAESKTVGNGRNQCTLLKASDGSVTLTMPFWTRAKTLLGISGFSGNNPYDTYQRKAKVRFTATFTKGDGTKQTIIKDVPVYQVRRVVNPKGVWRKAADDNSFHVILSRRENPKPETNFTPFTSEGAWRAYVSTTSEGASNFIYLSGGDEVRDGIVYGNTGSNIDFMINFTGQTVTGTTKCAMVTVEYHGYTCTHTIFVRQGYLTPITILGNAEWSSFSLFSCNDPNATYKANSGYYKATLTQNPLALGTLFKRGNYHQGILMKNNDRPGYGPREAVGDNTFELSDGTSASWSQISGLPYSNRASNSIIGGENTSWEWGKFVAEVDINGKKETRYYTLPTYEQYHELELKADYGLGVLYADGATETAMNVNDAYGFTDSKNNDNDGKGSICGMRGIIVYNKDNAHQIFFPLGKNGMGRRTVAPLTLEANKMGVLRYGGVINELTYESNPNNVYRPIPYNLPASPGAIYWLKKPVSNNMAWDMNYFDFNFNAYDYAVGYKTLNGNDNNGGDALPIRLVRTTGPSTK